MRFSFNTDDLEPAARFEAFRDHLVRRLFQLDLVSRSDGPYRGLVDLDVTASAVFGRVCGSDADFVRTPGVARQCERGVWLLFARDGRMGVGQGDIASILKPGERDLYLTPSGRMKGIVSGRAMPANRMPVNQTRG